MLMPGDLYKFSGSKHGASYVSLGPSGLLDFRVLHVAARQSSRYRRPDQGRFRSERHLSSSERFKISKRQPPGDDTPGWKIRHELFPTRSELRRHDFSLFGRGRYAGAGTEEFTESGTNDRGNAYEHFRRGFSLRLQAFGQELTGVSGTCFG